MARSYRRIVFLTLIEGSLLSFGAESIVFSLLSKNIKITICRNTVVLVALYGYEIWSLTLREERRLRMYENKVLMIIFGPKRDEVAGEWRKLDNEELNDFCSSPNTIWVIKSRIMSWTGHVAHMGERRGV
jgi:DNA-binding transcriptional ArsR family regulator